MNRKAVLTFLSTFVSILMASCNPTNATPNYRATFQPEITKTETGNTLIVTGNFTAVILTKEFLEERDPWVRPVPPSGYWTPKVDQVLALESKLAEYVAQNSSRFNSGHAPSKEEFSKFGRQYIGMINPEGSFILGSYFCPSYSNEIDWQNQVVSVMGGGDCFFGIWYDPDKQEFMVLGVNSPK